jgi:hypothetical protein
MSKKKERELEDDKSTFEKRKIIQKLIGLYLAATLQLGSGEVANILWT